MVLVTVLWVVEINYTNSSGKDELAILLPSCAYTCIYVSSKVGKIIELFLFNILPIGTFGLVGLVVWALNSEIQ